MDSYEEILAAAERAGISTRDAVEALTTGLDVGDLGRDADIVDSRWYVR